MRFRILVLNGSRSIGRQVGLRSGVLLTLLIGLTAVGAFSQTTAPAPRSADAIGADLQQAVGTFRNTIDGGRALHTEQSRKAAAPAIRLAADKVVSLLDEMSAAQPADKDGLDGTALQFRAIAAAVDDADQIASLQKSAAGGGAGAARAKAALAIAGYIKAPDDAERDKALDAFGIALKGAPDDEGILNLVSMTSLSTSPSIPIYQHLLKILKDDGQSAATQEPIDEINSDIKLKEMENKPLTIAAVSLNDPNFSTANWKGKVILVDFWATWCGPCLAELPHVKKIYSEYHGKGLEVLGVSCDNTGDDLRKFLAANPDMPWPQLFDDKTAGWHPLAKSYGIVTIPKLFLIDRKGILRSVDASSEMDDLIPRLLAEQP